MSDLSDLLENVADDDWLDQSACDSMDIDDFFVEAGHTISSDTVNVCRGCPVRAACVTHAYERRISGGYFGGMSPGQRRELSLAEALRFIANDPVQHQATSPR